MRKIVGVFPELRSLVVLLFISTFISQPIKAQLLELAPRCDDLIAYVADRVTLRQIKAILSTEDFETVSSEVAKFRLYTERIASGHKLNDDDVKEYTRAAFIYGLASELSSAVDEQNNVREYISDPDLASDAKEIIQSLRATITEKAKQISNFLKNVDAKQEQVENQSIPGLVRGEDLANSLRKYGPHAYDKVSAILNDFSARRIRGDVKVSFANKYRFFPVTINNGVQFRICVEILEDVYGQPIKFFVHRVAPHENFYQSLAHLKGGG